MNSFTTTSSVTFTVTHAKRIASKVAADLMRFHRFYGRPNRTWIDDYEEELKVLMQYDAIDEITYGFRKDDQWITAVKYKAVNGYLIGDDNPGCLRAVDDLSGATFGSFLSYSDNRERGSSACSSKSPIF